MDGHPEGALTGAAAILATGALLRQRVPPVPRRNGRPALGAGAPAGQSGIQLYNFSGYLFKRRGCRPPVPLPRPSRRRTASRRPRRRPLPARLERLFAYLQANGIKHVEAYYGYPGNPFPGTNGPATPVNVAGLQALRALGDKYGLRFPGRHGNLTEANWDDRIRASKILGQVVVGESGLPSGTTGSDSSPAPAEHGQRINRLGKRSVEADLGPAYFHNHHHEFSRRYAVRPQAAATTCTGPQERMEDPHRAHRPALGLRADRHRLVGLGPAYGSPPTPRPAPRRDRDHRQVPRSGSSPTTFEDIARDADPPACGDDEQRELGPGDVDFAPR